LISIFRLGELEISDIDARFGVTKKLNDSSTKAWLEKIRTSFIRKARSHLHLEHN
jgi:hypothetical protein